MPSYFVQGRTGMFDAHLGLLYSMLTVNLPFMRISYKTPSHTFADLRALGGDSFIAMLVTHTSYNIQLCISR